MDVRACLSTVSALLDQGAADSAVRMLRNAWEPELPDEHRAPLYCMWVRGLCDSGDVEHARVLAERAAEEFPRDADVLNALGNVLDLLDETDLALAVFERARDADPDSALAHFNLGAMLERADRPGQARRCYERACALAQAEGKASTEATLALGALLRRQDRIHEAVTVYEAYLDTDPTSVEVLVEHGICLSVLEEFEAACERFHLALAVEPSDTGALYNLAVTLFRMGDLDEAIDYMERADLAQPRSPLTWAMLGSWYLASARVAEDRALARLHGAIDHLRELDDAHGVVPSYGTVVVEEVFDALWQDGRDREARAVARLAGQRDWITPYMLDTLNAADHGPADQVTAFAVAARAEAREIPEHWPDDAHGYTTGLTVLAASEDEARAYTLEYLRSVENHPGVRFEVDVLDPAQAAESGSGWTLEELEPRARGVVQVHASRAYFRR